MASILYMYNARFECCIKRDGHLLLERVIYAGQKKITRFPLNKNHRSAVNINEHVL